MDECEAVEVFNYLSFDVEAREMRLSRYKALRLVVSRLDGRVLEGTSEIVARSDLDSYGRCCPCADGLEFNGPSLHPNCQRPISAGSA